MGYITIIFMHCVHTPVYPHGLPALEPELHERLDQHHQQLIHLIQQHQGFLPYEQWMQQALYAPNMGYYSGGSTKFAAAGDFTTAPELSPLFGQSLSTQLIQILQQCTQAAILEFGAGTGALAESILLSLQHQGLEAVPYYILELSPSLKARQQQRLAPWGSQVQWLDQLPVAFEGCVVANEVLDAMPVHLVERDASGAILECGVSLNPEPTATTVSPFVLVTRPAPADLAALADQRLPLQAGYRSEINLNAERWIKEMGHWLKKGAAFFIDYGFSQREYYHEQRRAGTLMCHFRHFAHDESLLLPGLQDITAHIDFTAMADAALEAHLDVLGYTSQAQFLINCGIAQHIEQLQSALNAQNTATASSKWTQQLSAIQTLLSEAEMGELFKVLAISQHIDPPLIGFMQRDRRDFL